MKRCFQRLNHPQRPLFWWFGVALIWLFVGTLSVPAKAQPRLKETYPRLMGMNIGLKKYDDPQYQRDLSRLDVVILGFYPYWKPRGTGKEPMRDVVKQIKKLNPNILVGQYTVLNEAYDNLGANIAEKDKYFKLYKEGWWLTDASGHKVQWTSQFNTWEVNFTKWAPPDSDGKRWPEWLAERDFRMYFSKVPEFDIWYFDNVLAVQRIKRADWDRDGKDERGDDPRVAQACREGHLSEWRTARRLAPQLMQLGNADNDLSSPEFKGQLEGAFLEGAMGWTWSLEKQVGWQKMMKRYRDLMANTAPPHMVGFNVAGASNDYRLFRYGFTSCLLDDGYFSYTDKQKGYSSVPWFDEYEVDLGRAVDPPVVAPWQKGVYRRLFEKGMVLVNPSDSEVTVTVEQGYREIAGRQDPKINHGRPVTAVTIGPKDGIVLVKQ
jgi:hypothetical protein